MCHFVQTGHTSLVKCEICQIAEEGILLLKLYVAFFCECHHPHFHFSAVLSVTIVSIVNYIQQQVIVEQVAISTVS